MEASKKTGREPLLRTVKRAELSQKKTMILRCFRAACPAGRRDLPSDHRF